MWHHAHSDTVHRQVSTCAHATEGVLRLCKGRPPSAVMDVCREVFIIIPFKLKDCKRRLPVMHLNVIGHHKIITQPK